MRKYYIGIDEVGRGSLAGPVTVAAFYLTPEFSDLISSLGLGELRDSKRLTKKAREKWFEYLKKDTSIKYAIASVSPRIIDRINIRKATNLASRRAYLKLIKKIESRKSNNLEVITDGGLFLGKDIIHKAIIRGDENFNAIKLASIVAKVYRDKFMSKRCGGLSVYNFKKHKGYGTKEHREAILKNGPSFIHRQTFIKKIKN